MMERKNRRAGILLPVTSLPGRYPIGDMGWEARQSIEWMKRAGIREWAILPLNPTSYGNSPYQALSAFAGNIYLISPDLLKEEGLLSEDDFDETDFRKQSNVNYGEVFAKRPLLLKKAFGRFCALDKTSQEDYRNFCKKNVWWLNDYAAFMVCKEQNEYAPWWNWDKNLAKRIEPEYSEYLRAHQKETEFWKFAQFKFFHQWTKLRKYANSRKIEIIGDMPFYVAPDSVDVWCHPELFEIDAASGRTILWAGVPADRFTNYDRNWGNPVYRWEIHKKTGYNWFRKRIRMASEMYDGLRIDHVIALMRYFGIRDGEKEGKWYDGPDTEKPLLSEAIRDEAEKAKMFIIAEDLGIVSPGLREMIQQNGWSGMRILQYAFTGKYGAKSSHLPFFHREDMVVYTGTHDNCTLKEYLDQIPEEELSYLKWWTKRETKEDLFGAIIEEAYKSPALRVIVPLQDILKLGKEAKMVYADDYKKSWLWRLEDFTVLNEDLARKLRALAVLTARFPFEGEEFKQYLECVN